MNLVARLGVLAALLAASLAAPPCDRAVPPLVSGYGAPGPYRVVVAGDVYLPDAPGKRPVVFFAHGFGPGDPSVYDSLLRHLAGRGYAVVYGTYPMLRASHAQRYDALWNSFSQAASQYAGRLDLTRVAFLGHS